MDSPSPAIEAEHLSKFYGQVLGLSDLSLAVGVGEVRGLLGQNGSGKSTLLKTLLGLIHPSSGWVRVLGVNVQKAPIAVRRLVGYVPESPRLYEFLTATEYLDFIADVRGLGYEEKRDRITRLIESLDLEGKQGETITGYSQGMKQKVAIIPGLKMSSSNSRELMALKILFRPSGDENPCPAQVCQNLDALTPSQYQTKFSLE